MSDAGKGDSVTPNENVGDVNLEKPLGGESNASSNGAVQYETYRRTVTENKKLKGQFEDLNTKFQTLEQNQLQTEGKKDELIDSLRKQNTDLGSKLKTSVGNFARSQAHRVVADEAIKMGCTSTNLLNKLVDGELDTLDFDDNFNPDKDQVKMMLEKIKNDEPVLFQKAGPNIATHIPKSQTFDPLKPDYDGMTKAELYKLAKQ